MAGVALKLLEFPAQTDRPFRAENEDKVSHTPWWYSGKRHDEAATHDSRLGLIPRTELRPKAEPQANDI